MAGKNKKAEGYDYVVHPDHYALFSAEDLKRMAARGESIDVDAVARAVGLHRDAYMYMVLKYVLRKNKPNEPRERDVRKIKRYSEMWIDANGGGA
jgi:hypothetical protein